jgi:nicotinate phosphoribosyltransferase
MAIITSLLDTDLYKLTQQQAVFHQYPNATVKYEFVCRNSNVKLGFLAENIKNEINQWKDISLIAQERAFLERMAPFLKRDYLDYLEKFRFNPDYVTISDIDGQLKIEINGPWVETILFEVPLLSTVNELYFEKTTSFANLKEEAISRLESKISLIKEYPRLIISEFGTRRRYSKEWQHFVFSELANLSQVIGTSNVNLASLFKTKAIGTVAHEFFSAHLALVDNIRQAQKRALHVWQQEYDNDLSIVLTDTFTTAAFFEDFDKTLSNTYAGVRHDSGDPIKFGWAMLSHYGSKGIDARTKKIIFSDNLNVPKAIEIYKTFSGLIEVSFGIGTNLVNDMGVDPLNIVIKLTKCNGKDVVKLSDNPGKHMGNPDVINKIKEAYNLR